MMEKLNIGDLVSVQVEYMNYHINFKEKIDYGFGFVMETPDTTDGFGYKIFFKKNPVLFGRAALRELIIKKLL